jgi:hypothetical protein
MTQRRAKIGGETGRNGEWYEGGKFIANTDRAKGHKVAGRATGRQLIAPGIFEVAPSDDVVAIFPQLTAGFFAFDGVQFGVVTNQAALDYFGAERLTTLRDQFNAGERWTKKGA